MKLIQLALGALLLGQSDTSSKRVIHHDELNRYVIEKKIERVEEMMDSLYKGINEVKIQQCIKKKK